jgi:protease I
MTDARLNGKRVAIIATDMVEQVELVEPRQALEDAGARTELISIEPGEIQGVDHFEKADRIPVDRAVEDADPSDYDALVIPGGVANPDALRRDEGMLRFTRDFFEQGKPVAAICHGPWMLVEAGVVVGRRLTSWPSLETDIRNAGGDWVDEEVVADGGLVTSRKPDDIPAFNRTMIEEFAEAGSRGGAMPPRGVKKGTKRARQYEHVKESELEQGASEDTAEEIAARTVNKARARAGESRTSSRVSTRDISSGRRGGRRSGTDRPKGRTREQLYAEARRMNLPGRSKMSKAQLQRAVDGRKGRSG